MQKKIIQQTQIMLDEGEAFVILHCLDYCWHRLKTCEGTGLEKQVKHPYVDELRTKMRDLLTK